MGEFAKWFERVVGVEILEVINAQCVIQVDIESRNLSRDSFEKESTQFRRCITSTKGDKETKTHRPMIRKKLGHR